MHEIKNILNLITSQTENALSTRFVPKVYKRDGRQKVNFDTWASRSFVFMGSNDDLVKKIAKLCRGDKMVLSHLIHFRARGLPIYMAQDYIAKKTNYTREYVNKRIKNLVAHGLIDKYNRGIKRSNVYKVASNFMDKNLWHDLAQYIPVIRGLFLFLITVQQVLNPYPERFFSASHYTDSKGLFTVLKNKDFNLNNLNTISMAKNKSSVGSYLKKKPETSKYSYNYVPPKKIEPKPVLPKQRVNIKAGEKLDSDKKPVQNYLDVNSFGEQVLNNFPEDVLDLVHNYIFKTQPAIYRRCSQLALFKSFVRKCEEEMMRQGYTRKPYDFNKYPDAHYVR